MKTPQLKKQSINNQHQDVMVDLETWGTKPGCAIISIGAVSFGPDGLGEEFYTVLDRVSCASVGLHEDADTLAWWAKQSDAAKETLLETESENAVPISKALVQFNNFLSGFGDNIKVWGNGSDFDNTILGSAYTATGIQPGWKFWNNRCYRTLKGIINGPRMQRSGTHHNALDDAISQANHAVELLKVAR